MTDTDCRFDPACLAREQDWINEDGQCKTWAYRCTRCSRLHWCIPALEVDGTVDSIAECIMAFNQVAVACFDDPEVEVRADRIVAWP